jgi:hypothetical protein
MSNLIEKLAIILVTLHPLDSTIIGRDRPRKSCGVVGYAFLAWLLEHTDDHLPHRLSDNDSEVGAQQTKTRRRSPSWRNNQRIGSVVEGRS